jgi:hypothetical protein
MDNADIVHILNLVLGLCLISVAALIVYFFVLCYREAKEEIRIKAFQAEAASYVPDYGDEEEPDYRDKAQEEVVSTPKFKKVTKAEREESDRRLKALIEEFRVAAEKDEREAKQFKKAYDSSSFRPPPLPKVESKPAEVNIATLPTKAGYTYDRADGIFQHTYGAGPSGSVAVQDASGRLQAVVEAPGPSGASTVRNASGVMTGIIENKPDGSAVVRDARGCIQTYIEKPIKFSSSVKTTFRSANGCLLGTREVFSNGRTEYRKASGVLCNPDFK